MNDQGTAENIFQIESIGVEDAVSVSFVAKERKQVAGMFGMWQTAGVIMISGMIERKSAVARFMNVHTIKLAVGRDVFVWQTVYFRFYQYAAEGNRIEVSDSVQRRIIGISDDFSVSAWISVLSHDSLPVFIIIIWDWYKICCVG